ASFSSPRAPRAQARVDWGSPVSASAKAPKVLPSWRFTRFSRADFRASYSRRADAPPAPESSVALPPLDIWAEVWARPARAVLPLTKKPRLNGVGAPCVEEWLF